MVRVLSSSIHDHVLPWRELPWPVRWAETFGRSAPLVLEVGYGNGEFLADLAVAQPDRDHVGIELSWSSATRLFKRLDKRGVTNVRTVLGDAEVCTGLLFEPGSLAEVHVNHPCPWPKARHEERRLIRPEVVALFASRLEPEGKLSIVTDHVEYAAQVMEVLRGQDALSTCHPERDDAEAPEPPGRKPTKYQLKAMAQGISIHYFSWRKVAEPPASAVPSFPTSSPRAEMPSVTLRGEHAFDELFADFEPIDLRETVDGVETVARLTNAYRQVGRPVWLLEALTNENGLRQEFGVLALAQRDGSILLKLTSLGFPKPTHAVRRAVWLAARLLREKYPGLELVNETLGRAASST